MLAKMRRTETMAKPKFDYNDKDGKIHPMTAGMYILHFEDGHEAWVTFDGKSVAPGGHGPLFIAQKDAYPGRVDPIRWIEKVV